VNAEKARYLSVISPGPLVIVRVPEPTPAWRRCILRALTDVMRVHGLRQKDISRIDVLWSDEDVDTHDQADLRERLEDAFDGGVRFKDFWLYDWKDNWFVCVREPIAKSTVRGAS
jgi:hypothetical protein